MLIAKSIPSFYEKHKEAILKIVASEQAKPIEDLTFSMYDLTGVPWYSFPDSVNLPLERLGKLEEFKLWISSGLHKDVVEAFCNEGDKILSEGIKGKGAAKIGFILTELKERKNLSIPIDLFYEMIAVQLIKEGENPHVFNQDIQNEKVQALRALAETGNFFFGMKELKQLHDYLNMSENEWNLYWQGSMVLHKARNEAVQRVLERE